MLPSPTPEMMIALAAVRTYVGDQPDKCSRFLNGMRTRLRSSKRLRSTVVLRQTIPEIEAAEEGALSTLTALCVVCPKRDVCRRPLQ